MIDNDQKQDEQQEETKAPVREDDDVYFFNPWDERFKEDSKSKLTGFDF